MDFLMKKFTLGIPVGLMLVMGVVATIGVSNAFAQSANDKSTVYNGTATVSLKKGPVNNVPVTIKITNSGDFSLKVDPKLTENHFGDTPIMGKVTA
jgi:hypothetical protein